MNMVPSLPRGGGGMSSLSDTIVETPRDEERIPLIRQYLRIAIRWRYVILGAVAACFFVGLVITLLMTPKYTAYTTVEISR